MYPVHLWFVCKQCNCSFQKVELFIEHKQETHQIDFQDTKCIVFEERTSDYNFLEGFPKLNCNLYLKQEQSSELNNFIGESNVNVGPEIPTSIPLPTHFLVNEAPSSFINVDVDTPLNFTKHLPHSENSDLTDQDLATTAKDESDSQGCTCSSSKRQIQVLKEDDPQLNIPETNINILQHPITIPMTMKQEIPLIPAPAILSQPHSPANPFVFLKRLPSGEQESSSISPPPIKYPTPVFPDPEVIIVTSEEEEGEAEGEEEGDGSGPESDEDSDCNNDLRPNTEIGSGRNKNLKKGQHKIKGAKYSTRGQFIFPTVDSGTDDEDMSLRDWLIRQMRPRLPTEGQDFHSKTNLILLDPDPTLTSAPMGPITPMNPSLCKLCFHELQSEKELKIHVKHCWHFNKRKHRYCTLCDKSLYAPKYLRRHVLNAHGAEVFEASGYSHYKYQLSHMEQLRQAKQHQHQHQQYNIKIKANKTKDKTKAKNKNKLQEQHREKKFLKERDRDSDSSSRPFNCTVCKKSFKLRTHLNFHLKTHTDYGRFKCSHPNCPEAFNNAEHLRSHLKLHEKFTCSSLIFNEQSTNDQCISSSVGSDHLTLIEWLKEQKQKSQSPQSEQMATDGCSADANSNPNPNTETNLILIDPDPTVEDIGQITTENFVTCRLCCAKLNDEFEVKEHVARCWLFNKKRHRYCVLCNRLFVSNIAYRNHAFNRHGTEEEKASRQKYRCQFCPKEFYERRYLRVHAESHLSREEQCRPFVCEFCGHSCRFRSDLTKHLRIHSEDRPFKCTIPGCTASFKQLRGLHSHQKIHADALLYDGQVQ